MAISDTIQSMYENVGNVYDVLELAGADLTNVDKNIENLKQSWEERLLYFLANGLDVVWNNWNKIGESGTTLNLNNTIQAKMDFIYKGNTSQESTIGKNLIKLRENESMGITTTPNSDGSVTINGTTTSNWFTIGNTINISIPAGTYTFSIQNTLSFNVRLDFTYNDDTYVNIGTITAGNTSRTFTLEKTTKSVFIEATNTTSGTQINEIIKFMLESGSSATSWEKFTGGNPAPNPDYPYPVNVVTGDNQIDISNKNLIYDFNHSKGTSTTLAGITYVVNENGSISVSGTATSNENYNLFSSLSFILPAGTYTLSGGINESAWVRLFDGTNYYDTYNSSGYIPKTFTINEETNFTVTLRVRNGVTVDGTFYPQLEKGSTATDYVPYQSQTYPINLGSMELCKIGDYQDYIAKSTGKNLFDANNYNLITVYFDGNILRGESANKSIYIPCEKNTTYTISKMPSKRFGVAYTTEIPANNVSIYGRIFNHDGNSITITTGNDAVYLVVWLLNGNMSGEITLEQAINTLQIEKGSTPTTYEPYGTYWYKYGAIGRYTFTGNENWGLWTTQDTSPYSHYLVDNLIDYNNSLGIDIRGVCNRYIVRNGGISTDISLGLRQIGDSLRRIYITTLESLSTLKLFKTYLSTHNVTLYYVLATPTITEITDTTLLSQLEAIKLSYNEQTNISQTNTDKPFILDVTALKDLDAEDTTPALTTNRGLLFTQPPVSENFINDEDDNSILEETINEEEPNIEDDNREEEEPVDFFEKEIINNDEEQEEIPTEPIEIDNGQR